MQEIIASMQRLAVRHRQVAGPRAGWHVGDIAWQWRRHAGREHVWRLRTWEDHAWSWLRTDTGTLEFDVHPEHRHLLDEILADPDARQTPAFDDDAEVLDALARHGFEKPVEVMHFFVRDVLTAPELPALPDGLRYRTVAETDVAERVAIHRDVWAPSRVTEESYANVRSTWPYRATLDCVVEAPDGRFAAYALLWPDDENSVGELEPVGVREEFRRRGLGAAVCTFALRRWHKVGGREAIVYCVTDAARALYESIGFRKHATLVTYSRP
jgi:ribosomal protein S18 acetylase RimI-like enzyme